MGVMNEKNSTQSRYLPTNGTRTAWRAAILTDQIAV